MKPEQLTDAMAWLDDEIILEVASTMKQNEMKTIRRRNPLRTLLIAAVICCLMATTAFAADLFGFRALLRGEMTDVNGEQTSTISISQPQDVPEGMSADVAKKVENSRAAWDEWYAWIGENNMGAKMQKELPEVFKVGKSYGVFENEDGTATIDILNDDGSKEQRDVTAEDYAAYRALLQKYARAGTPGGYTSAYDFSYGADSPEADAKLKEVADKYGMQLRGATNQVDYNLAPEEIAAKTADWGNGGNIFRQTPQGFDKAYWCNDGTFCVSYYHTTEAGNQATCYGYNSVYTTLSSGREVVQWEQNPDAFAERAYTTADGTDVTVLSNGVDAYLYVYLDNSFFAMHIWGGGALSDNDVNAIADYLNYSLISK